MFDARRYRRGSRRAPFDATTTTVRAHVSYVDDVSSSGAPRLFFRSTVFDFYAPLAARNRTSRTRSPFVNNSFGRFRYNFRCCRRNIRHVAGPAAPSDVGERRVADRGLNDRKMGKISSASAGAAAVATAAGDEKTTTAKGKPAPSGRVVSAVTARGTSDPPSGNISGVFAGLREPRDGRKCVWFSVRRSVRFTRNTRTFRAINARETIPETGRVDCG